MLRSKHYVDLDVNHMVIAVGKRSVDNASMTAAIDKSAFQVRFDEAMARAGVADNRVAFGVKLGGISSQKLYNWYKRDQRIPADQRKPLARLGLSIDWINDGEGDILLANQGPISLSETNSPYFRVDQLDAEVDMGDGRENSDYPEVIRSVEYTEAFIRSLVGFIPPPGRLKLFTGRGDSMIPVIHPGEVVLVDTGILSYDGDGIYLINTGRGQQIKALQDRGDAVYVVSANSLYPAFPFPRDGLIGGKLYIKNKIERFN